ncbi:Myeloid leukemia factor [Trema orientale]|uniref:Myeloid leukemia factor n=1 Tax=Trema orientale TaxID=63057 RepID=A0A2P5E5T2_TREOI|nr:Myeloid leukemia factor [Trema orientale]
MDHMSRSLMMKMKTWRISICSIEMITTGVIVCSRNPRLVALPFRAPLSLMVTFKESKETDTASRQATHKISRGLHNKGHFLTRKLNSDGKVDTMQTLHNLNEDELSGFEEAWKESAQKHLPGLTDNLSGYGDTRPSNNGLDSNGGWVLPLSEPSQHSSRLITDMRDRVGDAHS